MRKSDVMKAGQTITFVGLVAALERAFAGRQPERSFRSPIDHERSRQSPFAWPEIVKRFEITKSLSVLMESNQAAERAARSARIGSPAPEASSARSARATAAPHARKT